MDVVINAIEQGLLFSLVSMGVYITYKILDFPDLSVDGTFPLGAAISGVLIVKGVNPWIALIAAIVGGAIAGAVTGFLHVKLKISNLMSGILVMIGLYSVNLRIMGKSNLSLFSTEYLFKMSKIPYIILIFIVVLVFKLLLDIFLKTKTGLLLIAVGDNEQVVSSLGVNKNLVKVLGLMISNALVSMAGALTAQYQGFSDIQMGQGTVVMGLAAVVIGLSLFKKLSFMKITTVSILGAIIYKIIVALALWLNLNPNDLKLMTAIIVIIALASNSRINIKKKNKNKKAGDDVAGDSKVMQNIQP